MQKSNKLVIVSVYPFLSPLTLIIVNGLQPN
jgi:hypothetical protein